ncbi:hypothetical protein OJ998_28115 [Solirubrobacter taibaiensis]|nr:hypothetical protein [Solirubrobacter taibaiensis]
MLRAVLLAFAFVLLVAAPADAYRLGGKKWPVRTITYHASAPQYADAITAAVAAWNASGVRVRFKAVSRRSKARVKIVTGRVRSGPSGDAHLGYYRKSRVRLNRFDPAGKDPGWLAYEMQIVVAHELGARARPAPRDQAVLGHELRARGEVPEVARGLAVALPDARTR